MDFKQSSQSLVSDRRKWRNKKGQTKPEISPRKPGLPCPARAGGGRRPWECIGQRRAVGWPFAASGEDGPRRGLFPPSFWAGSTGSVTSRRISCWGGRSGGWRSLWLCQTASWRRHLRIVAAAGPVAKEMSWQLIGSVGQEKKGRGWQGTQWNEAFLACGGETGWETRSRPQHSHPGSSGKAQAGQPVSWFVWGEEGRWSYPNTWNPQRKSSMFSCHTRPSFTFHDRVSQVCLSDGHPGEGEGVPVLAETHSSLKQDQASNVVATVAASLISAPQGKAYILWRPGKKRGLMFIRCQTEWIQRHGSADQRAGIWEERWGVRGVAGRQSTKDLVCVYTWPLDTDNGAVRAWGGAG